MIENTQLSSLGDLSLFDRFGQATQSVLAGDVDAAWRSALTPQELTAGEKNALLRRYGLEEDSFQGRILKAVTNPAVVISLLLTYKFPIPSAKTLWKAKEGVDGMISRVPVLRTLASPRAIFRDTPVPDILDNIIESKSGLWNQYVRDGLAPALQQFERETGRAITAREQVIVFNWLQKLHTKALPGWEKDGIGVLMPGLDKAMTQPMRKYATAVRATLDDTLNNVWKNPENKANLKKAIDRMKRMGHDDPELDQLATLLDKDGFDGIADYMPHRAIRTQADTKRMQDAIYATLSQHEVSGGAQHKLLTFLGKEFYKRDGAMIPALQELQLIGDLVDTTEYARLQGAVRGRLLKGLSKDGAISQSALKRFERMSLDEIVEKGPGHLSPQERDKFLIGLSDHMPVQYSQRLQPVLEHYYNSVASTYAWTIRGHGPELVDQARRAKLLGRVNARAGWRSKMLEETLIPAALGRPSTRQLINAQLWHQSLGGIMGNLESGSVRRLLGNKNADWLLQRFRDSEGSYSLRGMSQKVAGYFYLSTLGLNPASAFKNHFQALLTGAGVGYKNALDGQMDAWKGANRYFTLRFGADKLDHASALKKAFPKFADADLVDTPITDEVLGRAFQNAHSIHGSAQGLSVYQKASRAAMAMFTATETSVRLGAFHAGLRKAAADGVKGQAALKFARQTVVRTQFAPSLADTPTAFLPGGPLANPLIRQLAQFPTRGIEFTLDGVRRASLGDPSQLVRQVAGISLGLELTDALGVNYGDALTGLAFPTFTNPRDAGTVLAPLPVVPPTVAIGAGVAVGLTGDWDIVHRQLPLFVPGGVGLSRALGMMPGPSDLPQKAARWLDRKYADYDNPGPDGRIPVYSGESRSFLGYYKPWELVKYGMGIAANDVNRESELSRILSREADAIRQTRREYLDAMMANDMSGASRIEAEYAQRFGHPLEIRPADMERAQEQRKMSRIERQLATMPKAGRASAEELARGKLGVGASAGILPDRGDVEMPTPVYTNRMGILDELDPYSMGRDRSGNPPTIPP